MRAKPSAAEADLCCGFAARLKPCPDEERKAEARRYVTAKAKADSSLAKGASGFGMTGGERKRNELQGTGR